MTLLSNTILLNCPYCRGKCQFKLIEESMREREREITRDKKFHLAYSCTNCNGIIATIWSVPLRSNDFCLEDYHPGVGKWVPQIKLSRITNNKIREDFQQAMKCYNGGLYDACMIMARRTIQQEMIDRKVDGNDLYKQIENAGISENLRNLLHKVRIFGNYGAHPDLCLYDNNNKEIKEGEKEGIAELSLDFLQKYLIDKYEIPSLINESPKREKN